MTTATLEQPEQVTAPEQSKQEIIAKKLDDFFMARAAGLEGDPLIHELLRLTRFDVTPEIGRCKTVLRLLSEASNRQQLYAELQELESQPDNSAELIKQARQDAKNAEREFEEQLAGIGEVEEGAEGGNAYDMRRANIPTLKPELERKLAEFRRRELDAQSARVDREGQIEEVTVALRKANEAYERLCEVALLPLHLRYDKDASKKADLTRQRAEAETVIIQGEAVLACLDPSKQYSSNDTPTPLLDSFAESIGSKIREVDLWERPRPYSGEFNWTTREENLHLFDELTDQVKVAIADARSKLKTISRLLAQLNQKSSNDFYQSRLQ